MKSEVEKVDVNEDKVNSFVEEVNSDIEEVHSDRGDPLRYKRSRFR